MIQDTVLITGATGLIGRHLCPLLIERGCEVHATSLDREMEGMPKARYHRTDLLLPGEARRLLGEIKPSLLIHLAWFVAPGRWADEPENVDWVKASIELAREFMLAGGKRMVVAGSCLEYDWKYGYCSENRTPCSPHTLYGAAKNSLRLVLEPFMRRMGGELAWARPFMIYGPHEHQDRLVPSVIRALLKEEPARCSHGRQVRDYLYVKDVAVAIAAIACSHIQGPVNICSGKPVAVGEMANRIATLMRRPELLELGAIPAAPTDTPFVVGDPGRLLNELNWNPKFSLSDGLTETIEWWRRGEGKVQ
jgi:nucleoside-diphosphate-sugar epimerase